MRKIVPALGAVLLAFAMGTALVQPGSRAVVASAYDAIRGDVVEPMAYETLSEKPFAYEACQDAHTTLDGLRWISVAISRYTAPTACRTSTSMRLG